MSDLKCLTAPAQSSIAQGPAKKGPGWPLAVGGLVIMAILIVAGIKYWPGGESEKPPEQTEERIMVAVLPFENLGAPEDEYFADGITDEITSRVGVLNGLGVIARTSILQYKGTTKRIGEIGNELGVDYILEGTIRWDKSGSVDKVRITPQLIRVSDETHLWADNIQRDLSEIFEVQEEIAVQVAGALDVALLTSERDELEYRPTENLEAYDYYLRAMNSRGLDRLLLLRAIEFLDKAIELDSTFALAYAMKSQAHSNYAFADELGASEHTRPARLAYQRAFELQPDLAEAHLARGVYFNLIERDYDRALKEFELALQGEVDRAQVLNAIAIVKMRQGKWHEAIAIDQEVIKLDPQAFLGGFVTTQANWIVHRYDKALEAVERAISIAPESAIFYRLKANLQVCMGASIDMIQETLTEWSHRATGKDYLIEVEGLTFLELFRLWDLPIDVDAKISAAKSRAHEFQDPNHLFYTGLLYKLTGRRDSSYLYIDSAIILIENRVAGARSDTTGRFEILELDHDIYDFLALAYSQTNRHEQAIEHAHLAIESMPIEACHW
ncbi:MAG: hypothetical protein GWN61_12225 [candidate division Zixibacteria bacterium]|nr:hypothetical protein [candidate division Zixibacteria bacterium]NIV06912.1 hypothetical protein [candidate division Zixibacteria bacterium]